MRIQKFEVVESTNDLARKYILEGNKEPAAFVAEHQTRGKGRLGRVWEDEPGKSLLVSFALPGSTYSNPPCLACYCRFCGRVFGFTPCAMGNQVAQ